MRRTFLEELPPDDAHAFERLRWITKEESGPKGTRYIVRMWRGKARKPFACYWFGSEEQREAWVQRQREAETESLNYKAERTQSRKAEREKMSAQLIVGSLLYTSWGYDQTNVEFYEITARKGATVTLRQIAAETVKETGWASANVKPRRGVYVGEPFNRRITAYGVKIDNVVSAWPCSDEERTHHSSWYA